MRARSVWERIGTLIWQEGADPKVSASFYRAVVQEIILYTSETWVLSVSMAKRIEGTHLEVMIMISGNREELLGDGTWEKPGGRRHMRGSGNPVRSDLHRATAGNRGTVDGATSLI